VRRAESDALRGDHAEEALQRAETVLAEETVAAEAPAVRATALRVKGIALIQLGRRDEGVALLEESSRLAEEEALPYEAALALDLLGEATGDAEAATRSRETLERLRVERIARPPLS
jgi:hypothetical protein